MLKLIKLEMLKDGDRLCLIEECTVSRRGTHQRFKERFYTVGRLPFLQGSDFSGDWVISLSMLYSVWRFDTLEEAQASFKEVLEEEQ
jgi:hypothetical protein